MVKRVGNLMPRIAEMENLREAFLRAARGKSDSRVVVDFRDHLQEKLEQMRSQLLSGTYQFDDYHFFTIYDPKKRVICAAPFQHRVVFHAMMRICHPVFDNYQINDSYASRIGKGTYKALERTQFFCKKYKWFAKMDVCKFFDSISHSVMLQQLNKLFKDRQLLLYFQELLASYEVAPACGLPIGNLTSQYFANHYLSLADHFAKEKMRISAMVRYMDDMLFFSNDKQQLKNDMMVLTEWINNQLRLSLHPLIINNVTYGIPFLGYVVYADYLRLNQRSKRRFRRKMQQMDTCFWLNMMPEREIASRSTCLFFFVDKTDSRAFKYKLYNEGQYS